jgi:hypothetical protein
MKSITLFLLTAFCVVSCGKSNDNNSTNNTKLTLLQQKWNLVKIYDTVGYDNAPTVYREFTGKPGDYFWFRPDKVLDILVDTFSSFRNSDPYKFIESPLSYTFDGDTFHIIELTSNKLDIYEKIRAGYTSSYSQHILLSR